MPSAIPANLVEDEIDDLLYLARANELQDLQSTISALAKTHHSTPENIITVAIDPQNGNGLLHMAAANGYDELLTYLLRPQTQPTQNAFKNINLQNSSGNTPLHWAALNGHLSAVKTLLAAGADPSLINKVGKDAVFEAERGERTEVVALLLGLGKEQEGNEDAADEEEEEEEKKIKEVEAGIRGIAVKEKEKEIEKG